MARGNLFAEELKLGQQHEDQNQDLELIGEHFTSVVFSLETFTSQFGPVEGAQRTRGIAGMAWVGSDWLPLHRRQQQHRLRSSCVKTGVTP